MDKAPSLPKAGTGLPTAEGSGSQRGLKYLENFLRKMRAAPEPSTHRPEDQPVGHFLGSLRVARADSGERS